MIKPCSAGCVKILSQAKEYISADGLAKVNEKVTQLAFPNGKKANNMLDAFIACTGTKVENYNPNKMVDFIA